TYHLEEESVTEDGKKCFEKDASRSLFLHEEMHYQPALPTTPDITGAAPQTIPIAAAFPRGLPHA
ncbi:MAG: hypothetical protein PWK00_04965, partial [Coxiella burnetii]|nr:hypothetical protein [Coxiella burnetii]